MSQRFLHEKEPIFVCQCGRLIKHFCGLFRRDRSRKEVTLTELTSEVPKVPELFGRL